jgi:hypothetical protein
VLSGADCYWFRTLAKVIHIYNIKKQLNWSYIIQEYDKSCQGRERLWQTHNSDFCCFNRSSTSLTADFLCWQQWVGSLSRSFTTELWFCVGPLFFSTKKWLWPRWIGDGWLTVRYINNKKEQPFMSYKIMLYKQHVLYASVWHDNCCMQVFLCIVYGCLFIKRSQSNAKLLIPLVFTFKFN